MKLTDEEIEIKETYTSKIGAWKMNREIIFKAKRKDNGEWVEGFVFEFKGEFYIMEMTQTFMTAYYNEESVVDFNMRAVEIDPNTLCQFTGLTDKNDQKIWENDIVQAWSEGSNAIGKVIRRVDGLYIMYPAYQKKEFWGLYPNENGKTTVEVIGNIFDNPELLEVE